LEPGIAIIAALPREIAGLVRGVRPDAQLLKRGIYLHRLPQAIVVAAGMGTERATLALEAARQSAPIKTIISTGLAGACDARLKAGAVAEADVVIDARTGERFSTNGGEGSFALVTTDTIAGIHEKARLAAAYGAAMVDMEASALARLALAHGLAFRAIKGISDAHDFELASLSRFAGRNGSFRTGAFALHTALRPHHWRKAMRLGQASTQALSALHQALNDVLAHEATRV
jgi:adenosylhomocysteine nucleosidase